MASAFQLPVDALPESIEINGNKLNVRVTNDDQKYTSRVGDNTDVEQVLQDIDRRTDGALNLRPGTLYRAINRLLGAGLLGETADTSHGKEDPRRRTYRMTPEGR